MQWANWMSLDMTVTHFAWMVQRFVCSMRPTTHAPAASCRHIIVHPWKHMSYLPTCMAILQTSHEKGSFQIRSSVLFWNHCISQRATVPGQYLLGFFTWPAHKNSFWGALPPTVGWSFLWAGSSLMAQPLQPSGPTVGWVMMMVTTLPLQLLCLLYLSFHLLSPRWSLFSQGWGWTGEGAFFPFLPSMPQSLFLTLSFHHLSPPSVVLSSFLPCWNLDKAG